MRTVRLAFSGLTITADLHQTATAEAIWAAAPFEAAILIWGGEVFFGAPVGAETEPAARDVISRGEIAYWPGGDAITIGYAPTPISKADEIRLRDRCNIWAIAREDVSLLQSVAPGSRVSVERLA